MASTAFHQTAVSSHSSHRRRESSGNAYPTEFNTTYPTSQPRTYGAGQQYWGNPTRAPPQQPRAKPGLKLQTSHKQSRTLPDVDDEDSMYPPHRSKHVHEARRPPRLQPSRHGRGPALGSPVTPTAVKKLGLRAPSSDLASLPEGSEERAALRRAEAEALSRYKVEREMEHARKQRRRSSSGEKQRSPLSARSDDAWGTSMYDVEVDGRR